MRKEEKPRRRKTKKQKLECFSDSGVFAPRLESRKTEKHELIKPFGRKDKRKTQQLSVY